MTETNANSSAVLVIAPDKPSGDAFNRILHQKGIKTEISYPQIAARVIGDAINPDRCCGFGGVMRMTHPCLSNSVADEKTKTIQETGASAVVTGCPGCMLQLKDQLGQKKSGVDVKHIIQVVDEAGS